MVNEDFEEKLIEKAAEIIHDSFREKFIIPTSSKIATYTLASYNLVNEYDFDEENNTSELIEELIPDVWRDYTKLTDYLFELNKYDRKWEHLNLHEQLYYLNLARKIILGAEEVI